MDDIVKILGQLDDDDKTIFQTEEERRQLEKELLGDDDTTEVDITNQMSNPNQPYWQQVFG